MFLVFHLQAWISLKHRWDRGFQWLQYLVTYHKPHPAAVQNGSVQPERLVGDDEDRRGNPQAVLGDKVH